MSGVFILTETLKILVTGAAGLLGEDVVRVLRSLGHEVFEIKDEKDVDLRNSEKTVETILKFRPEVVIHCAGTHDIDGVERNPKSSYDNIVLSTRNVVDACKMLEAILVYPGSDYIFDGNKNEPYVESDTPNPLNIYGKAKLACEKIITGELSKYFIIRLPILFGSGGSKNGNIIHKTYSEIKAGKSIMVSRDQVSSCGYTADVAKAFATILRTDHFGIYHLANQGYCSRYELYKEIARNLSLPVEKIIPCSSDELKRPAKRPRYTVLNTNLFEKTFGIKLRHWKDALAECIDEFKKKI